MTESVTLRDAIKTLIWGVICIAVGLLVWYNAAGNPLDELALIRRAKVAVGILSDTYEDQEGGNERHTYLYDRGIYSFQTPDGKQFLTSMDAPSGELKMQVEVEYLPDDPEVNRVRGEGNVTISSWLLVKVGVGTLFLCMLLAPGVLLIRNGIREIKQLRKALRSTRQLIPFAAVNAPIPIGQSRVIIARKGNLLISQWRLMEVRRNGQTIGTICPNGFLYLLKVKETRQTQIYYYISHGISMLVENAIGMLSRNRNIST